MPMSRWVSAVLLGLLCYPGLGCEPRDRGSEGDAWRLSDLEAVPADGLFLVSPRFDSAGRIEAAGRGGRGRRLLEPAAGRVGLLEPDRPAVPVGDDGFTTLYADTRRVVRWAPYWGEVQVVEGGRTTVLERQAAWGVVVSTDGGRVAWCLGHLPVARMVVKAADGRGLYAGPGAQPAWHPDGRRLVFVRPRAESDASGRPGLVGASLWLLDTPSGRLTGLGSPGIVLPMQPSVSPDGHSLIMADWATGRLLMGRLHGQQIGWPIGSGGEP